METEMHIGFRWDLSKEQIQELERVVTEKFWYRIVNNSICPNGHTNQKDEFCSKCGTKLQTIPTSILKNNFDWWLCFDEQCYYMTEDNMIYLSTDSGFCDISLRDLNELKLEEDELTEILNKFSSPIPIAFVVPFIYYTGDEE